MLLGFLYWLQRKPRANGTLFAKGPGDACSTDADCFPRSCQTSGGSKVCVQTCDPATPPSGCPTGTMCMNVDNQNICAKPAAAISSALPVPSASLSGAASPAATASITVPNVAPTATIGGAPASSLEGGAISLSSTVTDPSAADTAAGFSYTWAVMKQAASVQQAPGLTPLLQYATKVIDFTSQYDTTDWAAIQALGAPNVGGYAFPYSYKPVKAGKTHVANENFNPDFFIRLRQPVLPTCRRIREMRHKRNTASGFAERRASNL